MSNSLPKIPGGWRTRVIAVAGNSLELTLPDDADALLDDPDVRAANRRDDYMPYWAYLWPAATATAEYVARHVPLQPGEHVLELGCGVGLVGLGLLCEGAQVTFSDYDPLALRVAEHNARANEFETFSTLQLDWRNPPKLTFPTIVGCDLLYEERNHAPLVQLLGHMLFEGGTCWLGDPGRDIAGRFLSSAADQFDVCLFDKAAQRTASWRVGGFQMMRLRGRQDR